MTHDFPVFLRDMLAAPPRAGEGVHAWLFQVTRQLHAHLPASEIVALLETQVANCGRYVPRSEIVSAVQNSLACAWQPRGNAAQVQSAAKWPARDETGVAKIEADGIGLADLWECSPVRFEDNSNRADELIDALFPGNPLLCVAARTPADAVTLPREQWRGKLADCALIVPSPMTAPTGKTQDGRDSPRCLANVGPRRFLVVEFDTGGLDGQAARLWHLASKAPLSLAVHSGRKSLHGWFFCQGQMEETLRRFVRYAASIGADAATWTPCQLVRLPDGRRDTGEAQRTYYFNPATIKP